VRKHLRAIEGKSDGRLLVFNQPTDVAGIIRALGAVATKRAERVEKDLGGKSVKDMLSEVVKVPSLREGLMSELAKEPLLREALSAAMGGLKL
jgi:hypothetical protein